jgi:hypothetical protein
MKIRWGLQKLLESVLLPKNIDEQVGWRAVICKLFPPIAMAIGSRSCVFDESYYSLHNHPSFHLICSKKKLRKSKLFGF